MMLCCLILCFLSLPLIAQSGWVAGSPKIAYWKADEEDEIVNVIYGGPGATHNYLRPEWDQ